MGPLIPLFWTSGLLWVIKPDWAALFAVCRGVRGHVVSQNGRKSHKTDKLGLSYPDNDLNEDVIRRTKEIP